MELCRAPSSARPPQGKPTATNPNKWRAESTAKTAPAKAGPKLHLIPHLKGANQCSRDNKVSFSNSHTVTCHYNKILKDVSLCDLGRTKLLFSSAETLLDTIMIKNSIKHWMKGTETLLQNKGTDRKHSRKPMRTMQAETSKIHAEKGKTIKAEEIQWADFFNGWNRNNLLTQLPTVLLLCPAGGLPLGKVTLARACGLTQDSRSFQGLK